MRLPTHTSPWALRLWPCHTVLQRLSLRVSLVPASSLSSTLDCLSEYQSCSSKIPEKNCIDVVLLSSVHSLPMTVANHGYPYVLEVSDTVATVIDRVGHDTPPPCRLW